MEALLIFCPLFILLFFPMAFGQQPPTVDLSEPDSPDLAKALSLGMVQLYAGNSSSSASSMPEHFRLLELDGDHLLIGAADSVHNLSLSTFRPAHIFRWEPSEEQRQDCAMKSMDQGLCRNFLRVLGRLAQGQLLVCGTNAFRPMCRILSAQWDTLAEFEGTGLAPLEPGQNSSHLLTAGDQLYSATVTDFAGMDPLLFRRNVSDAKDRGLRTQRGNALQLDRPQFVGTLQNEEFVYLFFREEAAEADFQPATYSRVARVCKADRGGPRHYGQEWTSFVKARLNCSIAAGAHGRPFYFDQLVALSQPVHDGLVYATFVSEFDFLRHSVVCAFRLAQVDALFRSGPYLALDTGQRRWTARPRDDLTAGLGQCQPQSEGMSEDEALARRKFPLMADAVQNSMPRGAAAGIHRGSDHYSQIAVLPGVRHDSGHSDILYVATDRGNVLKLANLAENSSKAGNQSNSGVLPPQLEDPLVPIASFRLAHSPIRRLLISPPRKVGHGQAGGRGGSLIVVTDSIVYRLPLHFCAFHASCAQCVGSRDPHCGWLGGKCRGKDELEVGKNDAIWLQDVLAKKGGSQICAGEEGAAEGSREAVKKEAGNRNEHILTETSLLDAARNGHNAGAFVPKVGMNSLLARIGKCNCHGGGKIVGEEANCECNPAQLFRLDKSIGRKEGGGGKTQQHWGHELKVLPWWVPLLGLLACVQTLAALGWLLCKWHCRRMRTASGLGGANAKRCHPAGANFSPHSSASSRGGLISAYSPASILSAPTAASVVPQQSDHWTTLSTGAGCGAGSNRCSSTSTSSASSPKNSEQFGGEQRRNVPHWPGWSSLLMPPRRASIGAGGRGEGGEISVQLEGSAAPSSGLMTLPLPMDYHLLQQQRRMSSTLSTFGGRP